MRVGIYDGHLKTLGGGEQYALSIALWLLREGHQVDILAPPGTSIEACEQRLRLDLTGAKLISLAGGFPECEPEATERSATYDMFVNATHASRAPSRCARSMLIVYFPLPLDELPSLRGDELEAWTTLARRQRSCLHEAGGLHAPEPAGRWSAGRASYLVRSRPGMVGSTSVTLRAPWPASLPRPTATFLIDGQEVAKRRLSRRRDVRVRVPVDPTPDEKHRLLEICTESFSPAASGDSDDTRQLGAFIRAISPGDQVTSDQIRYGCLLHFVDTYEHLVAVSHYAAGWARRLWGTVIRSVVHPPVTPPPGRCDADRTQSIVVLGRFYGGPTSKKQLELVRAFAMLCDGGLSGWDLQLLGGVNDEPYVKEIEAAAAGYPVEVVRNASGALVEERLATTRLAWQATGWGEDPDLHPDRFEHFGIALVEAMGAGAIPVALDTGGPAEIVTPGHNGFLWSAREGPGPATLSIVGDPSSWRPLASHATERARDFSRDAFEAALARELMTGARKPA